MNNQSLGEAVATIGLQSKLKWKRIVAKMRIGIDGGTSASMLYWF